MRSVVRRFLLAGACLPALACAGAGVSLVSGWNLLGNGNAAPIAVETAFGNPDKVWTVWKWNKVTGKWAFYAPSLSPADLAKYAADHGYDVLTTIETKEGFWVRAQAAGTFDLGMPDVPPTPGSPTGSLEATDLVQGWNLVASSDNKNPSQLETGLRKALRKRGHAIVTAWAWDASTGGWRMHAPSLEAQGIEVLRWQLAQRGYQSFVTAPAPTDGFWLRVDTATPANDPPASAAVPTAKAFVATLRSNARALEATDLSLKTEMDAVVQDLQSRTVPVSESTMAALNLIQEAAQYWEDVVRDGSAPFDAQRSAGNGGWQCGLYADAAATTLATGRNEARYVACRTNARPDGDMFVEATDANGASKPCNAVGEVCGTAWTLRLRMEPDLTDANKYLVHTRTVASRMTVSAGTYGYYDSNAGQYVPDAATCPSGVSCSFQATAWNGTQTYSSAAAPGVAATLALTRNGDGTIQSVALQGDLAPSVVSHRQSWFGYDPALGQWIYRPNHTVEVLGDKHEVALSASWLQNQNSVDRLDVQGNIRLIRQGEVDSWIGIGPGSTFQATHDPAGSYTECSSGHAFNLTLQAGSAVSTLQGGLRVGACQRDRSGTENLPTQVVFTGSVGRNGAQPFFDGTIAVSDVGRAGFDATQAPGAANPAVGRVRIDGNVNIPNRPALSMQLDITGTDMGAASRVLWSGQYAQGTTIVNLSGYGDDAAQVLTMESNTGVRLVLDSRETEHPLTVGDVLAGYLYDDGTLEYTDGSYEQD